MRETRTELTLATFEESLKKLETIVDQLEKCDLPLEESLKLFQEGVGLSAVCKQELDAAEGKVQMLVMCPRLLIGTKTAKATVKIMTAMLER